MSTRILSHAEKEVIRNSPCGRCKRKPPFPDGSRCQPHRIIPGQQGGKYTKKNTVPRCNECHDIEHGGTGEAPFIGAATLGGKKGGKIGGKRVWELHRDHMLEVSRAANLKGASKGGAAGGIKKAWERHPERMRAAAQLGIKHLHEWYPAEVKAEWSRAGGKAGGTKTAEIHRNNGWARQKEFGFARHGKKASAHGLHVRRGVVDPSCEYCCRG